MRSSGGILGLGILLAAGAACARQPSLSPQESVDRRILTEAVLDPATATVGDRVVYRLNVERPAEVEVEVEPVPGSIGDLDVLDHSVAERRLARGRILESHDWTLRADGVGSHVLPPIAVTRRRAPEEAAVEDAASGIPQVEPLYLEVYSVLPESGEVEDIRDIKPLRPPRFELPWPWLLAALAGVALAFLWWRRRSRGSEPAASVAVAVPLPPADQEALAAIDRCLQQPSRTETEIRDSVFLLSGILRRYVERTFGLNATDLTSEEILSRVQSLALAPSARDILEDFLEQSDGIRYDSRIPSDASTAQVADMARHFVLSTRPNPEEENREAA